MDAQTDTPSLEGAFEAFVTLLIDNDEHEIRRQTLSLCKRLGTEPPESLGRLPNARRSTGHLILEQLEDEIRINHGPVRARAIHDVARAIWDRESALAVERSDCSLAWGVPRESPRAWAGVLCAQYHHRARADRGAALWWAAQGLIADAMMSEAHANDSGNENLLRYMLGVPDSTIARLRAVGIAAGQRPTADTTESRLAHMPESVLVDFFQQPESIPLVGPSDEYAFPACPAFVRALIDLVGEATDSSKGVWLEWLAAYLFCTVPGMRPRRNMITEEAASEVDLFVTRLARNAYDVPVVGGRWIAECKSTPNKIRPDEVGHFLAKMTFYRADFGVLIANVAGAEQTDDTLATASRALLRGHDRSCDRPCVIVAPSQLARVAEGSSFRDILCEAFDTLRYGSERKNPRPWEPRKATT